MTWRQLSLTCQAAQLDEVEDLMMELGALSISLRDAHDEPIYEPLPGESPVWRESVVSATFARDSDPEELAQRLLARLPPELASTVTEDSFQDRDWQQAYRQHFKPLQCAPKLWIVPTWSEPPDPDATIVRLDPGLAFGTGSHPTTALCLAWLAEQDLQNLRLIDYGCGSGILAIAAIKLGADRVLAVDIDEQALTACKSNMEVNVVTDAQIEVCLPAAAGETAVDLLMANILAGPLADLVGQFAKLVNPGGKIVLSGILVSQLNDIQSAYSDFFALEPARQSGDWACIGGRRLS
ncbi:50S ribosomal protein L11 methyltransferase [Draconibacterium sp.]|nr:50S ribosomal protein L11 methyltransferase [Draconibacterium sp.]